MKIKELDVVRLADGREGTVVYILGNGKAFMIDLEIDELPETVEADKIEKIVWRKHVQ